MARSVRRAGGLAIRAIDGQRGLLLPGEVEAALREEETFVVGAD